MGKYRTVPGVSSAAVNDVPILEFDPDRSAIIEPSHWHDPVEGIASRAVITWMADVFDDFIASTEVVERHRFVAESADVPIYEATVDGERLVVVRADIGGAISAGILEVLIAIGCRTFVAVGSSGGLTDRHPPGTVVVPDAAIRDEGVSYHYLAPGRTVHQDPGVQGALRAALDDAGLPHVGGAVWTTDALFRETPQRVTTRIAEGAVAVDMEAASLAAVATFRAVRLGHAVYIADTLHGDEWDSTALVNPDTGFRRRLLAAAIRACLDA